MKTKIIAEIGPNHNGSLDIALEIISKLKNKGIDFIKFQIANPNHVYSKDAFLAQYQKKNIKETSIKEMSKKLQLSQNSHKKLFDFCTKNKIRYTCSAFDTNSLKYIYQNCNLPFFKIPSGEILSLDILDFIKSKNLPILLSTGTSDLKEIEFSLNYLQSNGKKDITIMHCVSSYPAKLAEINMNFMTYLKNKFNTKVGYSDHSKGKHACLLAASMGAEYIEKHVTLDNKMIGPDHKASMEIDEFIDLVKDIKLINKVKGNFKKKLSIETNNIKKVAMKSCVTRRDLKKNQLLKKSDVCFKRPGTGIPPNQLEIYIGKRLNKNIYKDRVLKKEDF